MLSTIRHSQVESAIKKLKLGRAPGGDCKAPEMVKLALLYLLPLLFVNYSEKFGSAATFFPSEKKA